ncbi:GIY-YIG nuclease family protein [Clostridium beijerinckii]|uniref:GIY-YIG nuclease family protein n=1 Tax=Clostridium beijerinckii TaxID=1520 RepID=UPI00242FC38E|nr:GIY-YIG nuclease family protein [Clostridium beijerinckii]MDG5852449.1 GIY-YIG nuclease family protein [Clostridium beijerinckii]
MSSGFIYIMINDSFNGLIKIGKTTVDAEERAKQLSKGSGVPTPFRVASQLYVSNCDATEKKIHDELNDYRVNPNREFFKYPLHKAIDLIYMLNRTQQISWEEKYESIDILEELKEKFGEYINPKIISARIYQTEDTVYFEQTVYKYGDEGFLKDQLITRTDLGFIVEGESIDEPMFKSSHSVIENAQKFSILNSYSIINCFDDLFTEEGIQKAVEEYRLNNFK